jgi:hypothetical protein
MGTGVVLALLLGGWCPWVLAQEAGGVRRAARPDDASPPAHSQWVRGTRAAADHPVRFAIVLPSSIEGQSITAGEQANAAGGPRARLAGQREAHQRVLEALRSAGMQIEQTYAHRLMIVAQAPVAQLEPLFGVEFHEYRLEGERRVMTSSAPRLPRSIAPYVAAIVGLSDELYFRKGQSPGALAGASISQVQKAYNAAPLLAAGINGTGQGIGIIAPGNFKDSDIQQ